MLDTKLMEVFQHGVGDGFEYITQEKSNQWMDGIFFTSVSVMLNSKTLKTAMDTTLHHSSKRATLLRLLWQLDYLG